MQPNKQMCVNMESVKCQLKCINAMLFIIVYLSNNCVDCSKITSQFH